MIRLYVPDPLTQDLSITLSGSEAHYLASVMRLKVGDDVHLFNGQKGQWRCEVTQVTKREVALVALEQVMPPLRRPRRVRAVLAPIKPKRLEVAVEKLTELDVTDIHFVLTQHTQARHLNCERLALIAKEAAEQCERLDVPALYEPVPLVPWVEALKATPLVDVLLMADERQGEKTVLETLQSIPPTTDVAFLVGPEGGFAQEERVCLRALPQLVPVTLGPTILRAETAAIVVAGVMSSLKF
jgi:16S rRNA (uracil1498-N3)-methyltransferase